MAALQQEVLFVSDAEKQAEAMVNAIPVNQGLCVESPMGEQLDLWREGPDAFELHFHTSKMRGSLTLAIRAVARFLSIESRRAAALQVVSDAVGKVLGVNLASPGMANMGADHAFDPPPTGFNRDRCGKCGGSRQAHAANDSTLKN